MFDVINNSPLGYYTWLIIIAISLISISTIVIFDKVKQDEDESSNKNIRKISRQKLTREKLNSIISENMNYKKKTSIQKLILQAGYDFSPVDLYLMCIGLCSIFSLLVHFVLNNIFVTGVMGVIGYMLPKQVLNSKKRKRADKLNTQVGTFVNVVVARYEMLNDFSESLRLSLEECYDQEPIATEIRKTIMDLDLGLSVNEALENMALRTGNKYIYKLSNNYKISNDIGTKEARKKLLGYVIDEYNKESISKAQLKKELKGPVMEAYLMCAMVPGVMILNAFLTDNYVEFMTQEPLGKIGMAGIISVVFGGIWFINTKVNAPLE